MMQLGMDGVFVGSGIFHSGDPAKRAAAIVAAVANYTDASVIAKVSAGLGEAMSGTGNIKDSQVSFRERGH
jgi:pyridoxal 5'-phosphate synthase pdxS subunit